MTKYSEVFDEVLKEMGRGDDFDVIETVSWRHEVPRAIVKAALFKIKATRKVA